MALIGSAKEVPWRCGSEPIAALHPPTGGHGTSDDRGDHRWRRRVPAAARLGPAGGRLPDDPGHDVLPRRESGRDGDVCHGAARAAVRPDAWAQADDVDELIR